MATASHTDENVMPTAPTSELQQNMSKIRNASSKNIYIFIHPKIAIQQYSAHKKRKKTILHENIKKNTELHKLKCINYRRKKTGVRVSWKLMQITVEAEGLKEKTEIDGERKTEWTSSDEISRI